MPSFDPERGRADGGSPAAPSIPSFDSLRDPRRRTAVDVLAPGPPPASAAPPAAARVQAASRTPRPAEYADLLPFGLRLASALGGVPCRLVRWSVTGPVRFVRRLAGGVAGK